MKRHIRATTVALTTIAAVGTNEMFPLLWDVAFVRTLGGMFAVVIMLLFLFFRRLEALSGLDVLSDREIDRYIASKAEIRRKFWLCVTATSAVSAIIVLIAPIAASFQGAWYPTTVGFLFGINVSLALAVMAWIDELSSFSDELKVREQKRKNREAALKRLEDGRKLVEP